MEKYWLKNYPAGVGEHIDPGAYVSLTAVLEESFERYASQPAFSNMGRTLSYAEVDNLSHRFAAWLQNDLGLQQGDRVAVMMPNLLQYPVAVFGILRAGLTVVNTNPMYTRRELAHQLNDSGARAIVILENFASTLQGVLDDVPVEHVVTTRIGDMLPWPKSSLVNFAVKHVKKMVPAWHIERTVRFTDAIAAGKPQQFRPAQLSHADIAFLQYTGGTTGVAKGAMLTHGNLVANLLQSEAWISPLTEVGNEVIITALPLYHIFSLTANCLTFIKLGGKNVLITDPRDMAGFVNTLKNERFTTITGVNTLFNGLLHTPGFDQLDFSGLRVTLGGGMAVQRAVAERWRAVTGKPLIEAYGLTETSPAACINPLDIEEYNGSIGLPIPSTIVSIRDDDGGHVALGEVGEICIAGPQVMAGYWQRPSDTAQVMTEDGALRTGDMGRMDAHGYTFITDRKKDMILVSGFNVYPNELEDVAVSHPGVLEACAIGVPDEKSGEVVKLFAVRSDPALAVTQLASHCREHLTGYKVPRQIEFCDELPKSNVGKILRREVRERELARIKQPS